MTRPIEDVLITCNAKNAQLRLTYAQYSPLTYSSSTAATPVFTLDLRELAHAQSPTLRCVLHSDARTSSAFAH
eukprot:2016167-Pleurochrysis_carterae.AAC.1